MRMAERRTAADYLRAELKQSNLTIAHHPNGVPYLPDFPELSISISHTKGYLAVLLTPAAYTPGVDIEQRNRKVHTVRKRFVTPTEEQWLEHYASHEQTHWLHLLWCAKEVAYKIFVPADGAFLHFELAPPSSPDPLTAGWQLHYHQPHQPIESLTLFGQSTDHYHLLWAVK